MDELYTVTGQNLYRQGKILEYKIGSFHVNSTSGPHLTNSELGQKFVYVGINEI